MKMSRKGEKYGSKFVKFNLAHVPSSPSTPLLANDHNNIMYMCVKEYHLKCSIKK